jgi:lysophospholipase L1-like esterase
MTRKVLFALLAFFLFLLLFETAARILEYSLTDSSDEMLDNPGWQTEFFGSYFDWHQPDPDLLWRFKPNLDNPLIKTNSEYLLGDEIPKEKDEQTVRILILGDSSPVGLGLKSRQEAFDAILRYLLEMEYLGQKKFEIINAAVSGYTSEQIKHFLALKGWSYEPDIVVLYCGNNDASISGRYTDREILASQQLKTSRKLLTHFAFYRLLKSLLLYPTSTPEPSPTDLTVRVTPEQFAENLSDIAQQCRRHDRPLVLLKPPVPYLWPAGLQFKLFTHITGQDGRLIFPQAMADILGRPIKYCLDKQRFREIYGGGDIFTGAVYGSAYDDSMVPEEAIEFYSSRLEKDKKNFVLRNNLGVSFWQNGQYREAEFILKTARALFASKFKESNNKAVIAAGSPFLYNIGINLLSLSGTSPDSLYDTDYTAFIYLDSALQADYFSLRIKDEYVAAIDSLASSEKVAVIDLPAVFRANGGEKLFIDHCHPTMKGHYIMAEELTRVIKGIL